jgi:hypothetical protein
MNTTEPTIDEQIDGILSDYAYYYYRGYTNDEPEMARAKQAIKTLISDQVAKARKEERSLALMYLHDTNRGQDYLRKLATLTNDKEDV